MPGGKFITKTVVKTINGVLHILFVHHSALVTSSRHLINYMFTGSGWRLQTHKHEQGHTLGQEVLILELYKMQINEESVKPKYSDLRRFVFFNDDVRISESST